MENDTQRLYRHRPAPYLCICFCIHHNLHCSLLAALRSTCNCTKLHRALSHRIIYHHKSAGLGSPKLSKLQSFDFDIGWFRNHMLLLLPHIPYSHTMLSARRISIQIPLGLPCITQLSICSEKTCHPSRRALHFHCRLKIKKILYFNAFRMAFGRLVRCVDGGCGEMGAVSQRWQFWLAVPSPRHICTRRTLLMQSTEQCEHFSFGDTLAHIAQSNWQEKNKISLTRNHDFNTCNIYTEPS